MRAGAKPPLIVVCAIASCAAFLGVSEAQASSTSTTTLTLEDAYARARSRSVELLTARERIVQAELQVDRAWALLKPTLSASFTYRHTEPGTDPIEVPPIFSLSNVSEACSLGEGAMDFDLAACGAAVQAELRRVRETPSTVYEFPQDTASFRATVRWDVFNGRSFPLLSNAQDGVELEGHRAKAEENRLMLNVARAYLGAVAAGDAVQVAERAEARARARVALAEERSKVGEQVPKILEVERLGLAQAAIDVRRAQNTVLQAKLALAFAIGDEAPPGALVRPPPPQLPAETFDELIAEARQSREDVRVAQVALTVADRARTDVWWRFAPTVALFASFRYSTLAGLADRHDSWSMGVNARWNLYDGGLRYADLAEAASNERIARATLERVERAVAQDVVRARLKLEAATVTVERAQAVRALTEARTSLARTQTEAGSARPLDLAEAEDAERDAEAAVISTTLERDAAVLELLSAVGRFTP